MSILAKLTLVDARPITGRLAKLDPVKDRREKMIADINEQLAIFAADSKGEEFKRVKEVRKKDKLTGEKKTINKELRVRRWWWNDASGAPLLRVLYGVNTIELEKGKPAIRLKNAKEVPATLKLVAEAVAAGELDKQLETASARKPRVKK